MTYSRKRFAVLAIGWLAVVAVLFWVGALPGDMVADAQNTNCDSPPCMFPAEANIGGIVLGTSELTGEDLTGWDDVGTTEVAPNRVDSSDQAIGLGVNDVAAEDFFLYKSWKYDHPTQNERWNTYVWMGSDQGVLSGTNTCGTGSGDSTDGRQDCDLFVEVGEVSFGQIDAVGEVCIFLCVSFDITAEDYWVIDPQDDTECGIFDAVLAGDMCLELIMDGSFAGDTADVSIDAQDVLIRGHSIEAIEDSSGNNKELDLQNVYIEMRHRKGDDRAVVPVPYNQWANPIEDPDVTRAAALSNDFRCEGNPTQSDPSCEIDSDRQGWTGIGEESYDDIHR